MVGTWTGIPRRVAEQRKEIRGRIDEMNDERVVVRGLEADLGKIGDLAVVKLPGVDDRAVLPEILRVLRAEIRREDAAVGLDEIARGDGVAVAPLGVVAQVEGVGPAVGRNVPAFRDAGDGVEIVRVLGDEALEQRVEDVAVGLGDVGLRVEVLRFRAVAPDRKPGRGCPARRVRRGARSRKAEGQAEGRSKRLGGRRKCNDLCARGAVGECTGREYSRNISLHVTRNRHVPDGPVVVNELFASPR